MSALTKNRSIRVRSLARSGGLRSHARWAALVIAVTVGAPSVLRAEVIYVNHAAVGANNGESWTDAFTNLQAGLAAAASGDEIWVAKGIYHPAGPGGSRYATFQLKTGVGLYGGFVGTETSRDQRDFIANETILSGDLNEDDMVVEPESNCCAPHEGTGCDVPECAIDICAVEPECCTIGWYSYCADLAGSWCGLCNENLNTQDNAFNVLICDSDNCSGILDGFIITAGSADSFAPGPHLFGREGSGAGIWMIAGSPTISNCQVIKNSCRTGGCGMLIISDAEPSIENCYIVANKGVGPGTAAIGAMIRYGARSRFHNTRFELNTATGSGFGGGVVVMDTPTAADFSGCLFNNHEAVFGAGALLDVGGSAVFSGCMFSGNHASMSGGGLYAHGPKSVVVDNCVFTGNSSDDWAGALRIDPVTPGPLPGFLTDARISNCSFIENSAAVGGGLFVYSPSLGTIGVSNSIFWNNRDSSGVPIQGEIFATESVSNIDINYCTIEGLDSSIVGVGNSGLDPMFVDPDGPDNVVGTPDDDLRLAPDSPCIDAGSNSLVGTDVADLDGDGNTTEKTPLDLAENPRFLDDLNTPDMGEGSPPVVDMGAFEFIIDCNANHTPDDFDISTGTSLDEDGNGVPDECEGMGIVGSTPPPDSIDARQPLASGGNSGGWYSVQLDWDGLWTGAGQLSISELGGDGVAPGIAYAGLVNDRVFVLLTAPIEPGAWTVITYPDSGASTRIGFLPGDVNGDGVSSGVDILELVDVINGVRTLPMHSTDMNRDNVVDVIDVLRLIDMLNGAGGSEAWYMRSLPD